MLLVTPVYQAFHNKMANSFPTTVMLNENNKSVLDMVLSMFASAADTFRLGSRCSAPYLVVVIRSLVRHVKNPQRAGSLHAAPTCREVGLRVRGEGGGVKSQV